MLVDSESEDIAYLGAHSDNVQGVSLDPSILVQDVGDRAIRKNRSDGS